MKRQNTNSCIIVVAKILMLIIAFYPHDISAESQTPVFATWDIFEVDKCASIWLIKRFVDSEAQIRLYQKGEHIKDGIPFDTPDAKFRRYHNASTYETLLTHYKLGDKHLIYIGKIVHRQEAYPGNHSAIIDNDLWEQTQALLKANSQGWQSTDRLQMPFLLKGIVFDSHGNRFSPVQGRKGPRAYRYYVNQVVLQFRGTHPHQIRRMPAEPLEQGVINAVMEALKKEEGQGQRIDLPS